MNPRADSLLAALGVALLFLLAVGSMIALDGSPASRGAGDERQFHLPVIRTFAEQWPRPDLSDYRSATTPGYHLLLAAIAHYVSGDVRLLRSAGAVFAIALLVLLASAVGRHAPPLTAAALVAPVACSLYVFSSAAWLLPDDAGWLLVLATLLLALRGRADTALYLGGALVLLALVLVRQIHLWAASLLWLGAWLAPESQTGVDGARASADALLPRSSEELGRRAARTAVALIATLPAVLALAWLFQLWGGLMPPNQRGNVGGTNPAVGAMTLAILAVFTSFFSGYVMPAVYAALKRRDPGAMRALALGALSGALLGLVPTTSYSIDAGRYSGLWRLAQKAPVLAERSSAMALLAVAGGLAAGAWWVALKGRARSIFLVSIAAFIAANATSHNAFQRYLDPLLLMLMAVFAARMLDTGDSRGERPSRGTELGPALLAAVQLGITVVSLR